MQGRYDVSKFVNVFLNQGVEASKHMVFVMVSSQIMTVLRLLRSKSCSNNSLLRHCYSPKHRQLSNQMLGLRALGTPKAWMDSPTGVKQPNSHAHLIPDSVSTENIGWTGLRYLPKFGLEMNFQACIDTINRP